ncbi:hypothetical protein HC928_08510 [bacterium]|nr:hypothetical protein [bacterium]
MTVYTGTLSRFELPKNMLVVGASQSGKTHFLKKLLTHNEEMFTPHVSKIVYCFSVWQEKYEQLEHALGDLIEFRTDIPTKDELVQNWQDNRSETLLVLDDKMACLEDNAQGRAVVEIATVLCHHCHVSLIITLQNMYHASKAVREIGLNSQYICLFKNNRSVGQVRTLASQTMPTDIAFFMASYDLATTPNYGYLVVDLSSNIDKKFQLKSYIFQMSSPHFTSPKNESGQEKYYFSPGCSLPTR